MSMRSREKERARHSGTVKEINLLSGPRWYCRIQRGQMLRYERLPNGKRGTLQLVWAK